MKKLFTVLMVLSFSLFVKTVMAQISGGSYFIDQTATGSQLYPTGDYFTSFGDAISELETEGVGGVITFWVAEGQTFLENIEITQPFSGSGWINTVTFKYEGDNKPTLQPAAAAADNLAGVIDILNDGDYYITFEGLKINATNGGITYQRGVRIVWGPDHVTIKNCDVYDFSHEGIVVYWGGGGTEANAPEHCLVDGNEVFHDQLNSTTFSTIVGIWVNGGDSTVVSNNFVHDLIPGTTTMHGIQSGGPHDSNYVDIYNNFVTLGNNLTSDTQINGIFTQHTAGSVVNVYDNSVYISGAVDNATTFTTGIRLNNGATTNHFNNISSNVRTNNSGTGNHYSLYVNNSSVQYTGDYNDLYATGSFFAYRNTPISSLASWQGLWSQDLNSISVDPVFISTSDLHVRPNSPAGNAGIPIAMVTTDIDGESRDLTNPDIGADEFPDNTAPVITSSGTSPTLEGALYTYQVVVNDPDNGEIITYELTTAPAFLSVNSTGLVSGTPANDDVGSHPITILVTDLSGETDTENYTLVVQEVNTAPTISDIADQNIIEDSVLGPVAFTVNDEDDPNGSLTLSGSSDNLSLVPNGNIVFGGSGSNRTVAVTPLPNQFGVANITVTVSDGDLTGNDVFELTVALVNDTPVVTDIPNQTIAEGATFTSISLDDFVSDVDNSDAEMTWTATGNTDLTVDITDRVATITMPDVNWNGAETITLRATDPGTAFDEDAATFTVTAVDDAPVVIDIPDQSIAEGATFTAINLDDYVSDVDNTDAEMIWTTSGNTDLTVDLTNRVATITIPDVNWNGSETITFRATDPTDLFDEDAATFTVTAVNDAPVVSDILDQTIPEGSTFTTINLDDFVSDVDNSDAEMTWTATGNTDLTVDITDRVATITMPDVNWNGAETITFRATDLGSLFDEDAASFSVTAEADAPVVTDIPDQTIAEGGTFTTINLDDYVSDVDNTDSEMIWTVSGNTDLTVDITDRVATITTPDINWNGSETITFRATDPTELFDEDAAAFTVTAENDAPIVSDIPDQTIAEGSTFTIISLDDFVDDVDNTDAEMAWTANGNTELTVDITDRVATITIPDINWNGSETITFRATDPGTLFDEDSATFTVNNVNDPPVIAEIEPQMFDEDDSLSFTIAKLLEYVHDPDHPDSLLRPLFSSSENVTVSVVDDSLVIFSALEENWNGLDTLTIIVTDPESAADTAQIYFEVKPVNDAPFFVGLPDTVEMYLMAEEEMNIGNFADDYDFDMPDDSLRWEVSVSDDTLKFVFDPVTKDLTLTAPDYADVFTVFITVTDDSGATAEGSFYVNVTVDPTAIEILENEIPTSYVLKQNYPNPFNPTTHIKFGMPKAGNVIVEVYNVLGQKIITLYDGYKSAGYHIVDFEAQNFPTGIYFYRIQTNEFHKVKKMMLLK